MGTLLIFTDKVFERAQVSPNHYKTKLPGAVRTRCPRQHLKDSVCVPHKRDRSLVEKLAKLLFLNGFRDDLEYPHDHAIPLHMIGRLHA